MGRPWNQEADLRAQSRLLDRIVYDGHNRRPIGVTLHDLKERHRRRAVNQAMRAIVQTPPRRNRTASKVR